MILLLQAERYSFLNWTRLLYRLLSQTQLSFQCKCKKANAGMGRLVSPRQLLLLCELPPGDCLIRYTQITGDRTEQQGRHFILRLSFFFLKRLGRLWVACGNPYVLHSDSHPFIFAVIIMPNIDFLYKYSATPDILCMTVAIYIHLCWLIRDFCQMWPK